MKRTTVSTEVVKARSWEHAQKLLFRDAWDDGIKRFRSRFVFRGVEDSNFRLETSLMRLGGPYVDLERHLLRNFRKYSPRSAVVHDTIWHWLTLGQHYGLPTRVLDWTISPFIALHFAVWHANYMNRPGAVWMIDLVSWRSTLPRKVERVRAEAGIWAFDTDSLARIANSLPEFDGLSKKTFAVFYEPPSFDDRVVNQYAMLSALSNSSLAFDDWLESTQIPRRKIIIPARIKWEIRDKLDHCNINDRMLFPGLSGLCEWLKRFYGPGGTGSAKRIEKLTRRRAVAGMASSGSLRRAGAPTSTHGVTRMTQPE